MSGVNSLYRRPVPLDPAQHGRHGVLPLADWSIAADQRAAYLTATEFPQACLDLPVVFIDTGRPEPGGRPVVSPVALLGVRSGENLLVEGTRWVGRYIPASLRRYPFISAGLPGTSSHAVLVDGDWPGFGPGVGERLFDDASAPTTALQNAMHFLQRFDMEAERTRQFCSRLVELRVLKPIKADATLANGETFAIEGIQAIDEDRLHALSNADTLQLWRGGLLALMQAHLLSLVNLRHLVDRHSDRPASRAAAAAT